MQERILKIGVAASCRENQCILSHFDNCRHSLYNNEYLHDRWHLKLYWQSCWAIIYDVATTGGNNEHPNISRYAFSAIFMRSSDNSNKIQRSCGALIKKLIVSCFLLSLLQFFAGIGCVMKSRARGSHDLSCVLMYGMGHNESLPLLRLCRLLSWLSFSSAMEVLVMCQDTWTMHIKKFTALCQLQYSSGTICYSSCDVY